MKRAHHSTGAIYLIICNNPRAKRYLREETILICVIPGPSEPSLEQMNPVIDPMVDDLNRLYNGESSPTIILPINTQPWFRFTFQGSRSDRT